jgi:hypothetical protein
MGATHRVVRIAFRKVSDERHVLEIHRADQIETVACETRSYLVHDLLHYAVEAEVNTSVGIWGRLAAGRTLAELNDRNEIAMTMEGELGMIERVVGILTAAVKGGPAAVVPASSQADMPSWVDEAFVVAVQERMRHLLGCWRATPFGSTMELAWPAVGPARSTR